MLQNLISLKKFVKRSVLYALFFLSKFLRATLSSHTQQHKTNTLRIDWLTIYQPTTHNNLTDWLILNQTGLIEFELSLLDHEFKKKIFFRVTAFNICTANDCHVIMTNTIITWLLFMLWGRMWTCVCKQCLSEQF